MSGLSGLRLWAGLLLGSIMSCRPAAGQAVGSSQPTGTPGKPVQQEKEHGSFTAVLSAGNNSSFFGRTQNTQYPYAAGELTYKTTRGLWGSVVTYNVFNTASFIDETDVSLGWDVNLSKKADASISYSRFIFAENSPLVKSSVNNSLDGYVGYDWGYAYTRLNGTYLFGESSDFFVVLDNSRYFEIPELLTPKDYLSIEPRVSVMAGTQRFVETSIDQQQQRGNGRGRNKNAPTTSTTVTTTSFKLLNYELRVPLTYNLGVWAWQVAWRYSVPVNLLPDDVSGARSYFTTSLSVNL